MNCPHCDIEISVHSASRCFDAWLAVDVMGWQLGVREGKSNISSEGGIWSRHKDSMEGIPNYSTDISAAFEVIDKFGGGGFITIQGYLYDGRANYWYVGKRGHIGTKAETLPLAICRAAIKATINNRR